jgi:hypothetical protein
VSTYKDAGVDIDAGDRAVQLMKASIAKASRKEVVGGIGGFAGLLILSSYLFFYGEWLYQYAGLFIALAILPFVLTLISWLRGHHSDRLEEP